MCAILDVNAIHEVFGGKSKAGKQFLKWVKSGNGRLVVGGAQFGDEISKSRKFREWVIIAQKYGWLRLEDGNKVDAKKECLEKSGNCMSNDHHIIALGKSVVHAFCTPGTGICIRISRTSN